MDNTTMNLLSFYELIKRYEIKIPIIQRDYAQGRTSNNTICINFLEVLKNALINRQEINLDFVYGSILNNNVFQPLDGQQRLTTLYLLHWYAFKKDNHNDASSKALLLKFSYETRLSSRRFCEALVSNEVVISQESEKISDDIKNSEWFFMSWNQDLTIRAMLNTIDIIHALFQEIDDLWKLLTEETFIQFHLLILENFGLSDDLYIKMNARGRELTPFENLKAELQAKSQKQLWEQKTADDKKFAHRIDTVWTDFLWKSYKNNKIIDDSHMNLITIITMIKISTGESIKLTSQERPEIIQRLNETNSYRDLIKYITEDVYNYLYDCYELYSSIQEQNIPNLKLEMWRHQPSISILSQILLGEETSYTHKVLFYAQTEYLLKNKNSYSESAFNDWMRVIRNIVSRADMTADGKRPDIIRSPDTFTGVINLVKELAAGSDNIYSFLKNTSIKSQFAKEQLNEEILKSNIITNSPEYKDLIHRSEDNELLRGKIMLPIKCAGYKTFIQEIDFQLLESVQKVFQAHFNKELSTDAEEFDLFRRTMLSINVNGNYRFYDYWWSYWNALALEKRKLFTHFREIEYFINRSDFQEYFIKLLLILTTKSYREHIQLFTKEENLPNWQFRLIKEDGLLKNQCRSNYIAIASDQSYCYLLKSKRTSDIAACPKIE